jgi:hypothetical protein
MTTFLSLDAVVQSPSTPTEDPSGDFRQGAGLSRMRTPTQHGIWAIRYPMSMLCYSDGGLTKF